MKIVYGKQLNIDENKRVQEIAQHCGITFDTARLLFYRKQDSIEKAKRFLNPSKKHFHNPMLLENLYQSLLANYTILLTHIYHQHHNHRKLKRSRL